MNLNGASIVASEPQPLGEQFFYAFNPATGEQLEPGFAEASAEQVDAAVTAAENAFDDYRNRPISVRADFLIEIAEQLEVVGAELVVRANQETGLPQARLEGELGRTVNQLRMFSDFIRAGKHLQTQIDPALPERQPLPRPDLRMTQIPLGPVAVFGASNFPLAFSVAGGDTAAALAAGCPVVVRAHPAHPGTCELAAAAIDRAVEKQALPKGIFSLLQGSGHQIGAELVRHPLLQAVAFTGSQAGGRALFDLAAARPTPIPVFAEMGSVNPIFVLPQALQNGGKGLAQQYAESIALGTGQFCTNPGLLFAVASPALAGFAAAVELKLNGMTAAPMLHRGIKLNYQHRFRGLTAISGVDVNTGQDPVGDDCFVAPALLKTTAECFLADSQIAEEVFGPLSVLVVCKSFEQLRECAKSLQGQLTATIHAGTDEEHLCRKLFAILERKAGRLLLNGFPTGVEVCHAMVHGGPYPATTDSRSTSVGSEAVRRFLRPVCLQNFSPALLPDELQDR